MPPLAAQLADVHRLTYERYVDPWKVFEYNLARLRAARPLRLGISRDVLQLIEAVLRRALNEDQPMRLQDLNRRKLAQLLLPREAAADAGQIERKMNYLKKGIRELVDKGYLLVFECTAANLAAVQKFGILVHHRCCARSADGGQPRHYALHPSLFPHFKTPAFPEADSYAQGGYSWVPPSPASPSRIAVDKSERKFSEERRPDLSTGNDQTAGRKETEGKLQRFWGPDGLLGPAGGFDGWRARRLAEWARRGIKPRQELTILTMLVIDANREVSDRELEEHNRRKRQERAAFSEFSEDVGELVEAGPDPPD